MPIMAVLDSAVTSEATVNEGMVRSRTFRKGSAWGHSCRAKRPMKRRPTKIPPMTD